MAHEITKENPISNFIINFTSRNIYFSSYLVYIDENGDAAGNYTILSIKGVQDNSSMVYGLYPIGTFSAPNGNQIPVNSQYLLFDFIISLTIPRKLTNSVLIFVALHHKQKIKN